MKIKVIVCNCLIGVPEIELKNVRCCNDKAEHYSSITQYALLAPSKYSCCQALNSLIQGAASL